MVAVVMEQAVERLVSIREHVVCELVVFGIACPVELSVTSILFEGISFESLEKV